MSNPSTSDYPAPGPHDPLVEIFPDLFLLRGSFQPRPLVRFNRNMVIVREGDNLAVVNSVRLTEAGERELEALGNVRHVLRLPHFHGRDDRYYVDRYGAEFWAPRGARTEPGPAPDRYLEADGALPFAGGHVFLFRNTRHPEAAVLLKRDGGILLTGDSLQYYADYRFASPLMRVLMPLMGFPRRMIIGPLWLRAMTPRDGSLRADFEQLLALEFRHLVAAHGSLCRDDAHRRVSEAVRTAFGDG
jgi:hypothetical protein